MSIVQIFAIFRSRHSNLMSHKNNSRFCFVCCEIQRDHVQCRGSDVGSVGDVAACDTIQFHEQSWASQARGKKFHPLVQFSHLLPPQLPFLLISSPTAVDTFLLLSLSPSHCPNGIVLREEIPKVQSYKIIRGLDNAPRAGKSPQSSHCTTVIFHSS